MTEASRTRGSHPWRAVTSHAQDRAWFLDRLVPGSPAHTLSRAYLVTGELDLEALGAAWHEVTRRHEILRTTLAETGGRPVQEIAAAGRAAVPFTDLGALAWQAERWRAEQAAMPFDLATGPLARVAVARVGASQYMVCLQTHRAVSDARSMSILVDEVSACYAAAVEGRSPAGSLLPLPFQYVDYARRQRRRLDTPRHRRVLDWWVSALTPLPPPPALPVDRPRPPAPSLQEGVARFDWGEDLAGALAGFCRAEGKPAFAVLLAGFQALLCRYAGEQRVAVGVPVTVRPGDGFRDLIGPFENLLVLPADLSGGPTFRELTGRVAATAAGALDHRGLPFDQLVRALNADRDPRRLPLCDAVFVYHDAPESELRLPGAEVRRLRADDGLTGADLTLTADRPGSSVTGSLRYRESLFDHASARLILGQLRTLLSAALREPDLPVGELPLEEPHSVLAAVREADLTGADIPERPVHELVHQCARRDPHAVAIATDGYTVTYRELEREAAAVTLALRALGGVEGLPVAVRMSSGPGQIAASLGVLDAGARLVCLGAGDTGERGRAVLTDLRPACVVLDGESAGDELATWYVEELGGRLLDITGLDRDGDVPSARTEMGEPAYVTYTSGSTGRPKGIPQSHATFAQFVTWFAGEFGIGPGARVAQWAAPGYDASLVEAFAALTAGATLCPVPDRIRANPERIALWLSAERITHFQTVPSFARRLLGVVNERRPVERLIALGHLLLAGEALPGELANGLRSAFPWARLVNMYGPTESILATWHEVAGPAHGTVPIGTSIPGRQVLVLDERDRPCPPGVTGQIVIHSPYLTPGYAGAASGEVSAFRPVHDLAGSEGSVGRWYRTGDLGRRRWDGTLEFGGRRDFQIKFNGTRVELTDIEAALADEESVAECAVVPVADPQGLVTRLVAYVVPHATAVEQEVAPASLWRAGLRRRFGKSTLPVSFTTLSELPRNVGGKIDRRALPDPARSLAGASGVPESETGRAMAELWSELLGDEPGQAKAAFSANDTFFASGGHSLLVPVLLDRIRERFGVTVSLWEYFANPTIVGLSALVDTRISSTELLLTS
ncbi:hypothetical protein GCM10022226_14160 [Sphaerisporangium flaviroseum]|uniref:Carrier domain-containing protein n=1 Tax=Sphaerisporangium flaviroseum TaxID=509199 RepID=A0ABP7HLB6_9ACTN